MIFENIKSAPKDPILGITSEFNNDNNKRKVNLSVGVYQDNNGVTTTFESVLNAEKFYLIKTIQSHINQLMEIKNFYLNL